MKLQELLDTGKPIVIDGAMGTMLFGMGLEQGKMPELWNVEQPEKIRSVHAGYIKAGSQVILANTFGGNRLRLKHAELGERTAELNRAAVQIARQEADAADHPVVVGSSLGSTGQLLAPLGTLTYEEAVETFEEQAATLIDAGVDILWLETMSDLNEVSAAVEGCRNANADFPIAATMTFDTNGRTIMGVTPEKAAEKLTEFGVVAMGGNCGNGPDEIEAVIAKMRAAVPDAILIAKANAGIPRQEGASVVYDAKPEDMAAYALRVWEKGAQIIGACCGSTPAHIEAIATALRNV